jgi:hypothetical protein
MARKQEVPRLRRRKRRGRKEEVILVYKEL